jgi:two-component system OmpR family response regulator
MPVPDGFVAFWGFKPVMKLLFAEDDQAIAGHVISSLESAGFQIDHASTGPDAWELGSEGAHAAIILDLGLPGLDGLTILKRWRKDGLDTPVIVLTARGSWMERVDGFEAGADDYLPKPFRTEELLARIKALLRRASPRKSSVLSNGRINFDEANMQASLDGKQLDLSPLEARALQLFLHKAGSVVSPVEIATHVQGRGDDATTNSVEAMIARLRKKLGADAILTRRGFGYYIPGNAG